MSAAVSHLRLIDGNGEVVESTDIQEENRALRTSLVRAEKAIAGLKAKETRHRKEHALREQVTEVFEDWRALTGKTCRSKLSDDRFDGIVGMLEKGYTAEDFHHVSLGLRAYPYERYGKRFATGKRDERKDDIGWVCEKARRFENLAVLGRQQEPS